MDRLYPIGIQTFEKIREGDYCYVDKTEQIYQLAQSGQFYFLSRPRRFGKSLLISTLEAYFQGKKDLFTGLALEKLEQEWAEYPILHLDLNAQKYDSPQALEEMLDYALSQWEAKFETSAKEASPSLRFRSVIRKAAEQYGRNVVVLIDEYDKPLLQALENEELLASYRQQLKAFYGVLKSEDAHIRFALLTGVTKFSKVSVFSDLNSKRTSIGSAKLTKRISKKASFYLKNGTTGIISPPTARTSIIRSACSIRSREGTLAAIGSKQAPRPSSSNC